MGGLRVHRRDFGNVTTRGRTSDLLHATRFRLVDLVIEGWTQGGPVIARIPLTKAIRAATGYGLAEAKAGTDAVLSGRGRSADVFDKR